MNKSRLLFIPLIVCWLVAFWLVALAIPQTNRVHMPTPPASMDPDDTNKDPATSDLARRIDLLQLQQEAEDLARTAQTIPSDVASVRKGMLPKDVIQKLKQIEKMSKHLRSQLTP